MNRRALLRTGSFGAVALGLAACNAFSTSSDGGKKSVTINTASLNTDAQALITAAQAMLAAPSFAALLGPKAAAYSAALAAASLVVAQIATATQGSVTESVDVTNVQSLVTSLVGDMSNILAIASSVIPGLNGAIATQIGNYTAAIQTLVAFVQLAVSLATPASATSAPKMTEAQAVQIATH